MRFYFDLNKRHVIALFGMIVLVGIVIAQTPPNPGHDSTQLSVSGVGFSGAYPVFPNNNLNTWLGVLANSVNTLDTRVDNLEAGICPSGMNPIGDSCIDAVQHAPTIDYPTAVAYCRNQGKHLCSGREWISGCYAGMASSWGTPWGGSHGEWAGDIVTAASGNIDAAAVYGFGLFSANDCPKTHVAYNILDPRPAFRCCKNK